MGRLEFRVFARDLAGPRAALADGFPVLSCDERTDLYLLGAVTRGWKIRDGSQIDLKVLTGRAGIHERWTPGGMCRLPAGAADIRAAFAGAQDLPALDPDRLVRVEDAVAAFARQGFRAAEVHKARTRHDLGACLAEATRVTTAALPPVWSVAIEGDEAAALDELRALLGLGGAANCSFPAWLAATGR